MRLALGGRRRMRGVAMLVALLGVMHTTATPGQQRPQVAAVTEARALSHRVEQLYAQGHYQEALPLAEQALQMREHTLGPNHVDVGASLNNLAELYSATGQYERALPLYERALRVRETALGPRHPDVAQSLNDLAEMFRAMERYERAVPLHERALRIREAAFGLGHPDVAQSLDNLGQVFHDLGLLEQALPLHERALRIRETTLGPNHPDTGTSLSNTAQVLRAMVQLERARPLAERAVRIYESALGPNHPYTAVALFRLAQVFLGMGQNERALLLFERALHIREIALEPNHPDIGLSLNNVGVTLALMGRYGRAATLFGRAARIREVALGPNHSDVAQSLRNLAWMFRAMGQYERAVPLYERALRIHARALQSVASFEREQDLRAFLGMVRGDADARVSFAVEHGDARAARELGLQTVLLFKARDEEETVAILAALRRSTAPEDLTLLDEWTTAQRRAAALDARRLPPSERARLESALAFVEGRLARRSTALRERLELDDVDTLLPRVAARLADDAALVELASFKTFNAHARTELERWAGTAHYAAFVLYPDGQHAMVDLGEAAHIDAAARALFEAAAHPGADGDLAPVTHAGQALERLLFAPVRALLRADTHRLVLAPDGPLHLAPLHLMHDGQRFLIDRYTISYVTSGRDLLRERETPAQAIPPTMVAVTHYPVANWDRGGLRMQAAAMPALVPGVRLLVGEHATEHELCALQAPTLLHIATHGVFDVDVGGDDPQRGAMQRGRLLMADVRPDLSTPAQGDDGQVTASEVLTMNLRGTRLVVLSACETGQGNATVGQGVFGLRRAFLLAGAEALVTALWNVDDELSVRFMEALYRGLRAGHRSADALAEAVAAVRRIDPHPYAWAPFVLIGRDDVIDLGAAHTAGRPP